MGAGATDVVVVGAGLAGLSLARHLRQAGLATVVCEAAGDVGGRVATDQVDGFLLDRGFQVLLPAYPAVRRQVDLGALDLRLFARGLTFMTEAGPRQLVIPTTSPAPLGDLIAFGSQRPGDSATLAALALRDALAPVRWTRPVGADGSTARELRRWRVSDATTAQILRPFLAGVFLDPALSTSARLFHLIVRSFLRGGGALPANGMQALPRQIAAGLPAGTVRTGTEVSEVTASGIRTRDGEHIPARAVVLATDGTTAARLMPGLPAPAWHAVTTFYYRAPAGLPRTGLLTVDGLDDLLINTAVISDVAPGYAPPGSALVAASVPDRADASLESRVRERLAVLHATTARDWDLLASYAIARALPALPGGQPLRRKIRLAPGRYVCGDHRDTPSIQGTLVSARRAADAVLADLGHRPGPADRPS